MSSQFHCLCTSYHRETAHTFAVHPPHCQPVHPGVGRMACPHQQGGQTAALPSSGSGSDESRLIKPSAEIQPPYDQVDQVSHTPEAVRDESAAMVKKSPLDAEKPVEAKRPSDQVNQLDHAPGQREESGSSLGEIARDPVEPDPPQTTRNRPKIKITNKRKLPLDSEDPDTGGRPNKIRRVIIHVPNRSTQPHSTVVFSLRDGPSWKLDPSSTIWSFSSNSPSSAAGSTPYFSSTADSGSFSFLSISAPWITGPSSIFDYSPSEGISSTTAQRASEAPHLVLDAPSIESLSSIGESDQHSHDDMELLTTSHVNPTSSTVESENRQGVVQDTVNLETPSDAIVLETITPSKAAKTMQKVETNKKETGSSFQETRARPVRNRMTREERKIEKERQEQKKREDMYTPNIDPMADPRDDVPLPDPIELCKMIYTDVSSQYLEPRLGKEFPNTVSAPSKPLRVTWPEKTLEDHTKAKEAWAEKEKEWIRLGSRTRRNTWTLQPVPNNAKKLEAWLDSHGSPLQKKGYVTEWLKVSKEVKEDRKNFKPFRGALRIDDDDDAESLMKRIIEFAAVYDSVDINSDSEGYVARIPRIQSSPANEKSPKVVKLLGKGSKHHVSGHDAKGVENENAGMAAVSLLKLSVQSSIAVQHQTSIVDPNHTN